MRYSTIQKLKTQREELWNYLPDTKLKQKQILQEQSAAWWTGDANLEWWKMGGIGAGTMIDQSTNQGLAHLYYCFSNEELGLKKYNLSIKIF